uniref:Uncharacterized protein n=1 Tax=Cannabis sativa TaxID=3483 RepID=A0A803QRI8_CANSA
MLAQSGSIREHYKPESGWAERLGILPRVPAVPIWITAALPDRHPRDSGRQVNLFLLARPYSSGYRVRLCLLEPPARRAAPEVLQGVTSVIISMHSLGGSVILITEEQLHDPHAGVGVPTGLTTRPSAPVATAG